jgi:hypothetical protein
MRRAVITTAALVGVTGFLTLVVDGLAGPAPAAAGGLARFDSCDEVRHWYVEQALPHVGPYGLESPAGPLDGMQGVPRAAGAEDAAELGSREWQGSSDTGTNVQEVGVDEPDVAKTDGDILVRVGQGEVVVEDVSGQHARQLSRITLPEQMPSPELLLAGDRVLVLQSGLPAWRNGPPLPGPVAPRAGTARTVTPTPVEEQSRLLAVSVADPLIPRIESDQTFGGTLVSARQYDEHEGSTVRLLLRTGEPTLDWVQPDRHRSAGAAKERNKEILRASTISDWLPTVGTGDERELLVSCADVHHPTASAGSERLGAGWDSGPDAGPDVELGTTTVVSLPADDPTTWTSTAVAAAGETGYSSTDRLYLGTWAGVDTTQVHAFALEHGTAAYVASGDVAGRVRDRWSMDEHEGVLRVAVAHGPGWEPRENGITTLREVGRQLVEVGSVRGLGPEEDIKAVRWFDDLAVVVTFRETDPLYTVDLRDPRRPRALGELKVPGFSRYLHPVGGDRLLGIGQDASLEGVARGAQAAVFDIGDPTDPRRVDTAFLGDHSSTVAETDPRGFTWVPGVGVGLTTVTDHLHGRARVVALDVSSSGEITETAAWPVPPWVTHHVRALPLGAGRVALVSDDVQVVTVG